MAEWKRLCCAIDFSEPSRLAMQEAAELARRFDGQLELIHVHPLPPPAVAIDMPPVSPAFLEMELREPRDALAAWQEEAARITGRAVHATLASGSAAEEIVRYARDRAPDVVVLATNGRGGVARLLLGSVAERVVREAPCSVIVVRRREAAPSGARAAQPSPER
jgi:nucleotide-binding universal stress UspA family protein